MAIAQSNNAVYVRDHDFLILGSHKKGSYTEEGEFVEWNGLYP